ncbi:MAG: ribosomal-protein-alanine N-acetyltransferase [Actinomycetota bacterium]|jgi:ribosomal-protein-alanine N-acetyltransferase
MRDAAHSDIPDILTIEKQVFGTEAWSREVYESEFSLLGYSRIYKVIEENNRIVAYFGIAIVDGTLDITTIAVTPSHQRKGLACLMMDEILKLARDYEAKTLMLDVKPENSAAIGLYQKYGFEVVGLRRNYYGPSKDALTMQKVLQNV